MTIEEVAAAVSVAVAVAEEAAAVAVVAVLDQAVHEICIKQNVQTVVRKLKYLSNQIQKDQCTAENATLNINQKDINPNRTHLRY